MSEDDFLLVRIDCIVSIIIWNMTHCSVSILLIWGALTIITSGASYPPRWYYDDPDFFGENRCSEEVTEIRDDIRALKSLMEGLRQILDPDFKPTTVKEDLRDAVPCPEGFEHLSEAGVTGGCYKVIMEKHKWSSAMEQCQSLNPNAHLISIESREESDAVTKYLNKQFESRRAKQRCHRSGQPFGNTAFWTSGQRANMSDCSSEFAWKTTAKGGEAAFNYTHWADGEPNCWGGLEKCAEIFLNRQSLSFWNDVMCDITHCPICEYELKSGESTETPENPVPLEEKLQTTEAPDESSGSLRNI